MNPRILLLALAIHTSLLSGAAVGYADLKTVVSPTIVIPGEMFEATFSLVNNGSDPVETIEMQFLPSGGSPSAVSYTFDTPVAAGETREFTAAGFSCDVEGEDVYADISIVSVNGGDNYGSSAYMYVFCGSEFIPKRLVVEEGASVDCGWCPRGYETMEYMRQRYTSDDWIGISYQQHGDMAVTAAFPTFWGKMAGKPFAYANRDYNSSYSPLPQVFDELMTRTRQTPAVADVSARLAGDGAVEVSARFVFDYSDADFRVAYILTEDNLGPYLQRNYYAGGANGSFLGWENKSSYESLVYNDIARRGSDYDGVSGLIPANIAAGATYGFTLHPDLSYISNRANANISVLLTKGAGGKIVNAVRIPLVDTEAGITDVIADDNDGGGQLSLSGRRLTVSAPGAISAFDLASRCVARGSGNISVELPAGFYIVRCGERSYKIIIR